MDNNWLKKLLNPPIKLTEDEKKVDNIITLLLEKQSTIIKVDHPNYLLSNKDLDFHIEINGSVSVAHKETMVVKNYRLTVNEYLRSKVQKEESRRYKEEKELIFKKSLSLLDKMESKLKE
jgi:hypothetical protein